MTPVASHERRYSLLDLARQTRSKLNTYERLPDSNHDDTESVLTDNLDEKELKSHQDGDCITILSDANIQIRRGSLVVIIGSTGSGKSSLISGILGECILQKGEILVDDSCSISYVTQSPWIRNCSLRENIIFSNEETDSKASVSSLPAAYDVTRYNDVIHACALKADLEQLCDGDMTDIGEKGVNLSGGQQQRVALARAAYSQSDIIILDDPLSAVDGK
jgi:ATP-binding cassette subfamily C (CFTR/MRP) protein 1